MNDLYECVCRLMYLCVCFVYLLYLRKFILTFDVYTFVNTYISFVRLSLSLMHL